ncbi:MAG TPA: hypothetical protein VNN62_00095, partial [Methylomirabilota bacterium]|nr:hypothetical protein [Methylomirabilota bacterium]
CFAISSPIRTACMVVSSFVVCDMSFSCHSHTHFPRGSPYHPRTASGQTGSFQIQQSPNVAAMRWRGLLGG